MRCFLLSAFLLFVDQHVYTSIVVGITTGIDIALLRITTLGKRKTKCTIRRFDSFDYSHRYNLFDLLWFVNQTSKSLRDVLIASYRSL
mmetsp:Transcript_1863/g.2933  ORF Transcript_1863/g.2933 Transcript_1863/m.2933 type:complete len:88 (+) Transcript_1863:1122-1385(+)